MNVKMNGDFERLEEQHRILDELIAKEPGEAQHYVNRAQLHEESIKAHFDGAQKDYRQAAKLDAYFGDVKPLRDQFRCLLLCGALDDVIDEFTESIKNRKICLPLLEDFEKRLIAGQQVEDLRNRAVANFLADRFEEALVDISEAIRLTPHSNYCNIDPKNYELRAAAMAKLDRHEEAADDMALAKMLTRTLCPSPGIDCRQRYEEYTDGIAEPPQNF